MGNPFTSLPKEAFWQPSVAKIDPFDIDHVWAPKWPINTQTRIATFGSCFAQHFGAALRNRGFGWVNGEPAPQPLPLHLRQLYGYEVFSARTGNIYTSRQLRQWLMWSAGSIPVPDEVWFKDGRFYDPFRPSIEPDGFCSEEELTSLRQATINSMKGVIETAEVFIFTMGLTEAWVNKEFGYHYQSCPGTVAGEFDQNLHKFHNQTAVEIADDLQFCFNLMREINLDIKIILTVSPVPITATASGKHVMVANSFTKSTLRNVCGEMEMKFSFCDYFPSYDIVTSPPFRSMFYGKNLRNLSRFGVEFVIDHFSRALLHSKDYDPERPSTPDKNFVAEDPLCDDAILDKFSVR